MILKYSERGEMFSNETSHSVFSPPCSAGPFAKRVASHGLIQRSYYFKMDYVSAMRGTEGNEHCI